MLKIALFLLFTLPASIHAATITIKPFNGINGQSPSSAPTCLPASDSVPGIYGQAWCFGTTYLGGSNNGGAIYRVKPDGSKQKVLFSFDVLHGLTPSQQPAVSPDRQHLYGTTSQGGVNGSGLIYDFNLQTGEMSVLDSFAGPVGTTPQAPPILVGNTLYGITGQSGANGFGTIWSQSISDGHIQAMHSFAGGNSDVATPFGALTYNPADGLLYGMAFSGGANRLGGIFSTALDGSHYTLRASFSQTTGGAPQIGALLLGTDGMMYGNGWIAGANNGGTIFRFDPVTSDLRAIFNYVPGTGTQPYGQLAESPSSSWLYSVPWKGGKKGVGTILAVKKDGSAYRVLADFNTKTTGGLTAAGASIDGSGNYLVTALSGGARHHVGSLVFLKIPAGVR